MKRMKAIKVFPEWPVMEGEDTQKKSVSYERQLELLGMIEEGHRDIFEFGMETGLRPNELCAILVGDLDMKQGRALIQKGYSGAKFQLGRIKGRNKVWIPLSDRAYEIALRNSKNKFPGVFLFTHHQTGRGYTLKTLDNIWAKHTKRVVKMNEAMRHSFCTQISENSGANLLQ